MWLVGGFVGDGVGALVGAAVSSTAVGNDVVLLPATGISSLTISPSIPGVPMSPISCPVCSETLSAMDPFSTLAAMLFVTPPAIASTLVGSSLGLCSCSATTSKEILAPTFFPMHDP